MPTDSSQNSQSYYTNSTDSGSSIKREPEEEEETKAGSQNQSSSIQGTNTNISSKPPGRKRKQVTSPEDTKDDKDTRQTKRSVNARTSHNVDTERYGEGWRTGEDHYWGLDINHRFSSGDRSLYIKEDRRY